MARKSIEYTEDLYIVIENLILAGYTQGQVAEVLGIAPNTFSQHIAKDQHLRTIVTISVRKVIGQITASVIKKALGYTEVTKVLNKRGDIVEVEKHYPPDMLAASIYLNNREPDNWKAKRDGDTKSEKLVVHVTLDGEQAKDFKRRLSGGQKKKKDVKEIGEADYVIEDDKK